MHTWERKKMNHEYEEIEKNLTLKSQKLEQNGNNSIEKSENS